MARTVRIGVWALVIVGLIYGLMGLRGDDVTTGSSGSPTTQTTASNQFSGFTRGLMNEYLQQQLTKAPQPAPSGVKLLALAADPLGPVVQDLNGVLVALTIPASAKTNESFDVSVTITTTQASVTQPVLAISDKFPLGAYNIAGVSPTEPPADFTYSAHQPTVYNYGDNIAGFDWSQVPVAYQAGYKFIDLRENVPWRMGGYIFEWYNDHITWTVSGLQTAQAGNYNFAVFIGGLWISADGSQLIFGPAMVETTLPVQPGIIIPNAPSNLVAMAVSSSQINLTWQDNANNEQGFKIERKIGAAGVYSQFATVSSDVTSYSDKNLFPATNYYYQVRAYNQVGDSDYSNQSCARTFAPTPPSAGAINTMLTQYYQNGQIKNYGLYNSLSAKLTATQNSLDARNFNAATGQLNAFTNALKAQAGKGVTDEAVKSLTTATNNLIYYITPAKRFSGQHLVALFSPANWNTVKISAQETPTPYQGSPWDNHGFVAETTTGVLTISYVNTVGQCVEVQNIIDINNTTKSISYNGIPVTTIGDIFTTLPSYIGGDSATLLMDFSYPLTIEMETVAALQSQPGVVTYKTDKGTGITTQDNGGGKNYTQEEADAELAKLGLKDKVKQTAPPTDSYNCHGWMFTCGHKWVPMAGDVENILKDNGYKPCTLDRMPKVGDLAVYRSPKGIQHTGLVIEVDKQGVPTKVESKWAHLGRYEHAPLDVPPNYGSVEFWYTERVGTGPGKDRHTLTSEEAKCGCIGWEALIFIFLVRFIKRRKSIR